MRRGWILCIFLSSLLFGACSANKANTDALAAELLLLQGAWQTIYPASGTFSLSLRSTSGSFSRAYTPTCGGKPGTSPIYAFLVKRGSSNNLLINFMGGGACWTGNNCLGPSTTTTYSTSVAALQPATTVLGSSILDAGILNHMRSDNPFRDWNMVFVGYCSGDIHIGSNDISYTDPETGASRVIRHRGLDNTLSVLSYLQAVFPESSVNRVFVTGQSAGGYGAIFNFPFIKEMYYSRQVDVLGDAAAGALDISDTGASATAFQTMSSTNWNATAGVPTWIPTINGQYLTLTLGQFYSRVATYYETGASVTAPGRSRYAQYTSAFDGNQRYFYNVMRLSLRPSPKSYTTVDNMWGRSDGRDSQRLSSYPAYNVNCNWNNQMRTLGTAAAHTYYKKVIAPGNVHTISMSNSFYTQTIPTATGTVSLLDWYNNMLNGTNWTDAVCLHGSCSPPVTEESSPSAIDCSTMAGQGFATAGDGW